MEFLQDPIFTALLALVLSFLIAKIVSFAVSNSSSDVGFVASEGGAEKGMILERGLELRRGKVEKRAKFVDDVVIRRFVRYEGSENLVLLGDVEEMVAEDERVDQFGGAVDFGARESEEECCDERELNDDDDDKIEGSEKFEILFEKEGCGGDRDGENVVKSVSDERQGNGGNEEKKVSDDMVIDEREGNGGNKDKKVSDDMVIDEREGDGGNEEKKVRDESDDDWEGVERSELEKDFAEAVNYVECGGKGREEARLARLGSDVQMQLYGLHKVALEGPCLEPQPMALMVSARTKWCLIFILISFYKI